MKNELKKLDILVKRLKKIGIEITLMSNYPFIYLDKINGKRVDSIYFGDHGFTIALLPAKVGGELVFLDTKIIFKEIRKNCNQ